MGGGLDLIACFLATFLLHIVPYLDLEERSGVMFQL